MDAVQRELAQLPACDVLAIGPHPDDIEIGNAGTLLLLQRAGRRLALLDITGGEKGSRGTAAERAHEAAGAMALLGATVRSNLGLPDTGVAVDERSVQLLVQALRAVRPALLIGPHALDVHPDHSATAALLERAWFFAGLVHYAPQLGKPHRPRVFLRYPGNRPIEPSLVVDITSVAADKAAVVRCYRSQLNPPDRQHLVLGLDVAERAVVRDQFYGARIGARAGEPYWHDGPLPVRDLQLLLG
jgi:N-acetylglucosamine malate deacetylase 1